MVCQPYAVPTNVLMDLFGRFGNLIDVHLLSGKNYGYVKYASKESAEQAVKVHLPLTFLCYLYATYTFRINLLFNLYQ